MDEKINKNTRPWIVVHGVGSTTNFHDIGHSGLYELPQINDENFVALREEFKEFLQSNKARVVNVVATGLAVPFVLHELLQAPKVFRSVIAVNGTSRLGDSRYERVLSKIETKLPIGLPFRTRGGLLDMRPFLQRVRCPVLICTDKDVTSFQMLEAEELAARLPLAWRVSVSDFISSAHLKDMIEDFCTIPAKCPQKKRFS